MNNTQTALVKYIYLDVVGFTHNRSVEAQSYLIKALNSIVRQAVSRKVEESQVIYIPVGDGICISIIGSTKNYDDHIRIAEDIIRVIVNVYNPQHKADRKFEVRIGINENIDNIITDINGNKNVCGSGVNNAQRIMSFADSSQILVGRTIYDNLSPREQYSQSFRRYVRKTKHNVELEFYQYIGSNIAGLNKEPPTIFKPPPMPKLSKYAAYYIAHIIRNRKIIEDFCKQNPSETYGAALVMAYLAEDSVGHSEVDGIITTYNNHMPETPNNTIQEQLEVFTTIPFWVCVNSFEAKVQNNILTTYEDCFTSRSLGLIASELGIKKLQTEWPEIWAELRLDELDY